MIYDLPISIEIDGVNQNIRNKADYRVIIDVLIALNDINLSEQERLQCALFIFYEDLGNIQNIQYAVEEMFKFLNYGEEETNNSPRPRLMDWEQDFKHIVAPINNIIGKEIRSIDYLHWWSFLGAYMNIGECSFSTIVAIRNKLKKGQKLEKWEQDYLRENPNVRLKEKLTDEEQAFIDSWG